MPEVLETPDSEAGHDFTKKSFEDFATCNDCGSKIQFKDNPIAHAEMMAHKCSNTEQLTENQRFYRKSP